MTTTATRPTTTDQKAPQKPPSAAPHRGDLRLVTVALFTILACAAAVAGRVAAHAPTLVWAAAGAVASLTYLFALAATRVRTAVEERAG